MATMMRQQEEEEGRRTNIAWPNCTICRSDYDNDHIPIVLICCGQSVCLDCFQKHHANQVIELDVNEIWYSCPISNCRLSKNTGFNRSNRCYVLNRSLMDILGIDPAYSSSNNVANTSNTNEVPSVDGSSGENNDARSSAVLAGNTVGGAGNEDIIDLSQNDDSPESNQSTVTNVLRRSQRTRRPTVPHNVVEDTTVARDAKRSRRTVARDAVSVSERSRGVIVNEQQTEESDAVARLSLFHHQIL